MRITQFPSLFLIEKSKLPALSEKAVAAKTNTIRQKLFPSFRSAEFSQTPVTLQIAGLIPAVLELYIQQLRNHYPYFNWNYIKACTSISIDSSKLFVNQLKIARMI